MPYHPINREPGRVDTTVCARCDAVPELAALGLERRPVEHLYRKTSALAAEPCTIPRTDLIYPSDLSEKLGHERVRDNPLRQALEEVTFLARASDKDGATGGAGVQKDGGEGSRHWDAWTRALSLVLRMRAC